jgi:hypothetical protein
MDAAETLQANSSEPWRPKMESSKWILFRNNQNVGPLTLDQLRHLANTGQIGADAYVRRVEDVDWIFLSQVPGFQHPPAATPPVLAAPASIPPVAQIRRAEETIGVFIDYGFKRYVTLRILSITWLACVVLVVLYNSYVVYKALSEWAYGFESVLWRITSALIGSVVALLFVRVVLESIAVIFNIARSLSSIDAKMQDKG